MGLFEVTIGPMGSSKSARAIADVKNLKYQGQKVFVLKPKLDDRDGDKISSRLINESIQVNLVLEPDERINKQRLIEENYDCIVADEIHMFSVETIEDLYEISAISDTEIHLYGLSMSWKGKPFLTTAMALAYADKIHKIESTDKQKNLLTHHIKKVGNTPCDITQEGGEIDTGDLGKGKYFTVSKQTFYNLYGMLGQIGKPVETKTATTTENVRETAVHEPNKCQCKSLLGKAYPTAGQVVKLKKEACSRLWKYYKLGSIELHREEGYMVMIDGDQFVIDVCGFTLRVGIDEFNILIEGQLFEPYIDNKAIHDSMGRYCHVDITN